MHLGHETPDYYGTSELARIFTDVHADLTVDPNDGYGGGGSLTGSSANAYGVMFHDYPGQSTFYVGGRFKCTSLPGARKIIRAIKDPTGAIQCCVALETDGTLTIWEGNLTTQLAQSTLGIDDLAALGTQLDFGFSGVVSLSSGVAEVWMGEAGDPTTWQLMVRAAGLGVSTAGGGNDETWRADHFGTTTTIHWSHLYWRDGQPPTTGLVPGYYVTPRFPASAGVYNGYIPNTGTLPDALDDAAADDDTTYGACVQTDQSFSVGVDTTPASRAILAVDLVAMVRNFSGYASLAYVPRVVLNAATSPVAKDSAGWRYPTDSEWRNLRWGMGLNPLTLLPWLVSELNAAEFGGLAKP